MALLVFGFTAAPQNKMLVFNLAPVSWLRSALNARSRSGQSVVSVASNIGPEHLRSRSVAIELTLVTGL